MSQAMSTLTATAATSGDATANMPKQISETPHRSDKVEARRTRSEEFCAINASSTDGASLSQWIRGCNSGGRLTLRAAEGGATAPVSKSAGSLCGDLRP